MIVYHYAEEFIGGGARYHHVFKPGVHPQPAFGGREPGLLKLFFVKRVYCRLRDLSKKKC